MMLITPFTAFAPHSVPPGPRITSIRSMSSRGGSCTSHHTPPKVGVYASRPSTKTSILALKRLLNPRALTSQTCELCWATCNPGTMRSASGMDEKPPRTMSCPVTTKIAAGASNKLSVFFDGEVTSMFISSSMLLLPRSFGVSCDRAGIVVTTAAAKLRQHRLRTLRTPDLRDAAAKHPALWFHPRRAFILLPPTRAPMKTQPPRGNGKDDLTAMETSLSEGGLLRTGHSVRTTVRWAVNREEIRAYSNSSPC